MDFVVRLAQGAHIIALQETRGTERDLSEFVDVLPGWAAYGSFIAEGASGGVVFLVSLAVASLYVDRWVSVVVQGRITILRMRGDGVPPLDIVNLHLVPTGSQNIATQLRRLSAHVAPLRDAVTVAVGDANICAPGEGRLDLVIGHLAVDTSSLVNLMGKAMADFDEIVAQGFSRVQRRGGQPQLLSRIDRVFTNSPIQGLMGGRCFAQYVVGVLDRALPSDHAPLEVRFLPPRSDERFRVPKWALRHPLYAERLAEASEAIHRAGLHPLEALRQIAHVARAAVAEVRRSRISAGPRAFAWQAHWLAAARSCWGRGDAAGLEPAIRECPSHRALFFGEGHAVRPDVQDEEIAKAMRSLCHAQVLIEMHEDLAKARSQEEAQTIRSRAARSLAAFSPRHRKVLCMAVRDPEAEEIYSQPASVGRVVAQH